MNNFKSGEEEEEELFKSRSKLFLWKIESWQLQGLGDIKILENKGLNTYRLVMRKEEVLTVCCNMAKG